MMREVLARVLRDAGAAPVHTELTPSEVVERARRGRRRALVRRSLAATAAAAGLAVAAVVVPPAIMRADDEPVPPGEPPGPSVTRSGDASPTPTRTTSPSRSGEEPSLSGRPSVPRKPGSLVDVRVGRHDTYDRVVFDFAGEPPEYRHHTVHGAVNSPGAGGSVQLAGDSALVITFESPNVGTPPRPPITPGLPAVREVRVLGGFEGYVTVAIGISSERFTARFGSTSDSVYVDVPHRDGGGGGDGGEQTRRCGDVGFEPNTDSGAFDIRATGVSCATARGVAADAENRAPGRYTSQGLTCRSEPTGGELPATRYTCTRPRDEARVTFTVS